MTSLISAISGQFTKALVLGAFFPSVLSVVLTILFVLPIFPGTTNVFLPLASLDQQWRVFAASFAALLLTGLVYNLNTPIIRLYEGYPWKDSWIGKKRSTRHKERLRRARTLRARLRYLRDYLNETEPGFAASRRGQEEQTVLAQIVNTRYPGGGDHLVLPTRLGNVIRNFEQYPVVQYGLSAIAFWPKLVAKIDERYSQTIDSEKASFDFMINASALSGGIALVLVFSGVLTAQRLGLNSFTGQWLLRVAAFVLISWLSYEGSVTQAASWGAQVKGAFDLYRMDLLKQLGYSQQPYDRNEERALWTAINYRMVYPDKPREPQPPYAALQTRVVVSPDWMNVRVLRGVVESDSGLEVGLEVRNLEGRRTAESVIVLDAVAEGSEYVWGSAYCDFAESAMLGTRPMSYELKGLEAGQAARIVYRLTKDGDKKDPSSSGMTR